MQFFIILAVTLGCALADGRTQYLSDSPDVASAKLAHFEAKAKAAAAVGAAPDYVTSYYLNYYKNLNAPAAITVLPNGFLADTPEVSAAKASFNAEFAKATAAAAANPEYSNDYYNYYFKSSNANQYNANANKANQYNANANNANPNNANPNYYIPANIVVQSNGYLADTPEVSAAKASFNAEFAKATAAAAANPEYSNDYYNYYFKSSNANQYNANANKANQYNANANNANPNNANPNYYIPANIVVQSNGYLADTPEVSAAKASFNAEFAKATAAAAANPEYSNDYYNYYYKSSNANNANQYNANANNANQNNANQNNANPNYYIPANIVVQSNGYLADTPEVSAAKASFNAEFAKATAAAAANPEYINDYYNYYFKSSNANQYNANANQYNANANNANQYNANANNADQNKANPNYYTPANIVVQPDGYLADTPEVAAAKASHNTEVALATAAAATNQENSNNYNYYYKSYNNANNNQYNNANQEAANPNYYIPANIVVQSNGYLADTPEVAAAKASHNAEFAKAAAAAAANPDYSDNYYNNYYANPNNAYSTYNYKAANNNNYYYKYYTNANPNTYIPANIVVQPNGYLADTPEVAAAKAFHNAAFTKAAAAAAVNPDNSNYNTQANN